MIIKLLTLSLLVICARAQYCAECMAKYEQCAAACYTKSGYQPACIGFTLAGNRPPAEEDYQLFPSECAAKCHYDSFAGLRRYTGFAVQYYQKNSASCEQEWKTMTAATYTFDSSLNQFKPYMKPPAPWIQAEIDANSPEYQAELAQLQSGQVDALLGSCFVCDKTLASDKPTGGTAAIAPKPTPPKVPKPAPTPSPAATPSPAVAPSPFPSPAPAPKQPAPAPKPPPVVVSVLPTIIPKPAPAPGPKAPVPAVLPPRGPVAPIIPVNPIARLPAPAPAPSDAEGRSLLWIAIGLALAIWFLG